MSDDFIEPPNLRPPQGSEPRSSVGCVAYGIAALSFVPLIGVLFGIISIVWGAVARAWSLVIVGVCGILFTVAVYGSLFYFGFHQRGGVYDKLRNQMAVQMLDETMKDVEFYKLQQGHYPAKLGDLNAGGKKAGFSNGVDPTAMQRGNTKDPFFFYELDPSGNFYFLRSVGPDGVPFTADDILPSLSDDDRKNTGLRLER